MQFSTEKKDPGPAAELSVIICTYNRADELQETLRSWASVKGAGQRVELIVVDNNSSDHTAQTVESYRPSCPTRLRYVFETNPGLSYARNRGIKESAAELVALVDDDVLFDEEWLRAILKAFHGDPSISCIGGKSLPVFESARPEWVTEEMFGIYGSTRSGEVDRPMVFPEYPFGLNMAFRMSVFEKVGCFSIHLGRKKSSLLSNEELEMFYRVNQAGLKVQYVAGALLYHRIPSERMTKSWLASRYYWQGISDMAYQLSLRPRSRWNLAWKGLSLLIGVVLPPGKRAPGKLVHYYRNLTFKNRLFMLRQLGMSRQAFYSIFYGSQPAEAGKAVDDGEPIICKR